MSLDLVKDQIQLAEQEDDNSTHRRQPPEPLSAEERKRERAVVWKLDLYIGPLIFLLQFVSNIDKGNIGFAATQGLTADIGLKGNELNACVSVFYVLYILAEIPAAPLVKRIGFHRFVPCIVGIWGLVCMCTGFVQSYGGLMAARLVLGAAEGCLFPSLSIFLLNWYGGEEMGLRIFFLFGAPAVAGAFGGLLAFAILHMNGVAGYPGWRWLYIIEGLITLVFSFACFFIIPKSYESAYFLSADDKRIMRRRAELAEAYSGGTGHYTWKDVRLALTDPKVWVSGVCQHATIAILYGFGTFLPVIIKTGLGYSTVQAQYLTIPVFVWGTLVYFTVALLSDRFSSRFIPLMCLAPFMMAVHDGEVGQHPPLRVGGVRPLRQIRLGLQHGGGLELVQRQPVRELVVACLVPGRGRDARAGPPQGPVVGVVPLVELVLVDTGALGCREDEEHSSRDGFLAVFGQG